MNFDFRKGSLYPYRWLSIFQLLSLERVEPYLPMMGLSLEHVKSIREVARKFVVEFYEKRTQDTLDANLLLVKTFEQISERASNNETQRLYDWGHKIFNYGDSFEQVARIFLDYWSKAFKLVGQKAKEPGFRIGPLSTSKEAEVLQIIRREFLIPAQTSEMILFIDDLPKSEWDRQLYSLVDTHRVASATDLLYGVILDYRTMRTGQSLRNVMNEKEQTGFAGWITVHLAAFPRGFMIEVPISMIIDPLSLPELKE